MVGIKKWPEQTATSPSGWHLGIYKSLLNDSHHEKPGEPITTKGIDIMQDIYQLLVLAVKHTHTFQCWQTIWNMFLKKGIGNPRLDWLQTLHLIEADLNLLWKWYSSMGFIKRAEDQNNIADNQYGGHAGQCAIDLACKQIATFGIYQIIRKCTCEVSNDARHCFDRMCKTCQNLSCWQQGADLHYLNYMHKRNPNFATTWNTHTEYQPTSTVTQRTCHGMVPDKVLQMQHQGGSYKQTALWKHTNHKLLCLPCQHLTTNQISHNTLMHFWMTHGCPTMGHNHKTSPMSLSPHKAT